MKIYPSLRLLWAALVVSAVTGLGSLFPENGVSLAASILNLAAYGVVLYILHPLYLPFFCPVSNITSPGFNFIFCIFA